jgi:8-oxo-dGTP pyrophosphatase MutT (NUDIX family)
MTSSRRGDVSPAAEPMLRDAARVLLVDGRDRILLLKWRLRSGDHVWINPGGGLLPGESHPEAALRELREEVGLTGVDLGPWIWHREQVLEWNGRPIRQRERHFLVRVAAHEVDRSGNDEQELRVLEDMRWWSLPELQTAADVFAPRRIAFFAEPLLAGQIPAKPVDVGV